MLSQVELGVVVEEGPSVSTAFAVALAVNALFDIRVALFEQCHCRQRIQVRDDHVRHKLFLEVLVVEVVGHPQKIENIDRVYLLGFVRDLPGIAIVDEKMESAGVHPVRYH